MINIALLPLRFSVGFNDDPPRLGETRQPRKLRRCLRDAASPAFPSGSGPSGWLRAETFGSWFLVLGFLAPIGALAPTGTMLVAACRHILDQQFQHYISIGPVVLYLGASVALLLTGPGRYSCDAGMVSEAFSSSRALGSANPGLTTTPPARRPAAAVGGAAQTDHINASHASHEADRRCRNHYRSPVLIYVHCPRPDPSPWVS